LDPATRRREEMPGYAGNRRIPKDGKSIRVGAGGLYNDTAFVN
jgi:hypothetical protein